MILYLIGLNCSYFAIVHHQNTSFLWNVHHRRTFLRKILRSEITHRKIKVSKKVQPLWTVQSLWTLSPKMGLVWFPIFGDTTPILGAFIDSAHFWAEQAAISKKIKTSPSNATKVTKNNSQSMPYFIRKSFLRLVCLPAYIFICLDHQLALRDDFTRSKTLFIKIFLFLGVTVEC